MFLFNSCKALLTKFFLLLITAHVVIVACTKDAKKAAVEMEELGVGVGGAKDPESCNLSFPLICIDIGKEGKVGSSAYSSRFVLFCCIFNGYFHRIVASSLDGTR